ncbi:hypothetical protein [Methanosphaera cuniculi]|uniref:hypothetical protein n=1 Tax=Methanosphaera cuniculi TaxID=1077256 RepID=UPI0026F1FC26|nr:hypothetical protein [Methanosphaera cuniculi]
MLFELLMIFLIIIIVSVLIIIFSKIHVDIIFKNSNSNFDGLITINCHIFQIKYNLKKQLLEINLHLKNKTKTLKIINTKKQDETDKSENSNADKTQQDETDKSENLDADKTQQDETDKSENPDADETQQDDKDIDIKQLLKDVSNAKVDILEIIAYIPKIIKFNNAKIQLNLGLADDELTTKATAIIYSIGAVLYPAGLYIELIPVYGEFKIKSDMDIKFDIIIFNCLKLIVKIIRKPKLRKLIKKLISYAQ